MIIELIIREETPSDYDEVYAMVKKAFATADHSDGTEQDYLNAVRKKDEFSWGQRAVRFYDVDHHIIEVAESIVMVTKRFIDSGLTIEQTAKRMDVGMEYIQAILKQ